MPDLVPSRRASKELRRQAEADARQQSQIDRKVYEHSLVAWQKSQIDQIDSMTLRDAVQVAFDEECAFYDHAMTKANGSEAKARIVADKLEILTTADNRRIMNRFNKP